ncbi:MAG: hypothetical protein H7831_01365 [Magnetococcus sp. WYHC-3]
MTDTPTPPEQDPLRPRLMLFLSVDMSGSTALKNSHDRTSTTQPLAWLDFMQEFHREFPNMLGKRIKDPELREEFGACVPGGKESCEPDLWKSLGDELIFKLELSNHRQAALVVGAFWHTLADYNKQLRTKLDNLKPDKFPDLNTRDAMGVKGTAWVAGFPVTNATILAQGSQGEEDYIGPQIDIGFRLGKHANRRKLIVSVDLALLLVEFTNPITVYFDGCVPIKGVLQDKPYPLFWISLNPTNWNNITGFNSDGSTLLEDSLYGPCQSNAVKRYARSFLETEANRTLMVPFIVGDPVFNKKPPRYDEELRMVQQSYGPRPSDDGNQTEDQPEINEASPPLNHFLEEVNALEQQSTPSPRPVEHFDSSD